MALLASQVLVWITLLALGVAVLALARQVGVLFQRVAPAGALTTASGPSVGEAAAQLTLRSLQGEAIRIGGASADGTSTLLMFVSAQCPICRTLIPTALRFAKAERLRVVFAGDAPVSEQNTLIERYGIAHVPFLNSTDLGRTFGVDKLPHAVLIDDRGIIVSRGLVNSREHLESLVVSRELGFASVQDYLRSRHDHPHQIAS